MINQKIKLFLISFLLFLPVLAEAIVTCEIDRVGLQKNITIQGADITAGADVPVGSPIYSGLVSSEADPGALSGMICQETNRREYTIQLYSKLIGGMGEIGDGIYETGLPGVGIIFYNNVYNGDTDTPLSNKDKRLQTTINFTRNSQCPNIAYCRLGSQLAFGFLLIKTGNISAGSINGAMLPKISITATSPNAGAVVPPGEISSVTFNGSLNIKAGSCKTPGNYDVELGSYNIKDIAESKSSPWVDASIILTDCPSFTGMVDTNSDYSLWLYPNQGPSHTASNSPNFLEVTLSPLTSTGIASEGTFLIDKNNKSASGVDIQLYKGTTDNATPVALQQPYNINIVNNGSSIKVPLIARYLRNGDALSPGKATGKVVYLINYK